VFVDTVFIDDVFAKIEAARAAGMIAIQHRDNQETIGQLTVALDE
jgi:FMN phosphatase YigB (HAD superfamily)